MPPAKFLTLIRNCTIKTPSFAIFNEAGTSDVVAAHGALDAMEQLYPAFKARYREYRQFGAQLTGARDQ